MNRRDCIFLIGNAAALPLSAHAQQGAKVPRVGVLSPGNPPPGDPFRQAERFEAGLVELGWKPGASILIEYRYAEGKLDRLPAMAAELVAIPVNVIVARGQTMAAVRAATNTIPVVMASDPDPIGNGLIKSLARPGGNITGLTTQVFELEAKQLEYLRLAVPALTRVAVLTSGRNTVANSEQNRRRAEAARALAIELLDIPISDAAELDGGFVRMRTAGVGAVLISGTLWFVDPRVVAAMALTHRLAIVTNLREFAEAGALMTYGVSFAEVHRRSAAYVDKILKGANPAEIPVEQPTKFDLLINLSTAKALGLTIPPSLLLRADEVIE